MSEDPFNIAIQTAAIEPDCVIQALDKFHETRDSRLHALLKWMPILLFPAVVLAVIFTRDTYLMFISWMIALIFIFIIFNHLMDGIPKCLRDLWERDAVTAKNHESQSGERDQELDAGSKRQMLCDETMKSYCRFITDFEENLNDRKQWMLGLVFAVFLSIRSFYEFWISLPPNTMGWLPVEAGGSIAAFEILRINLLTYFTKHAINAPMEFLSGLILEPLLGFVLGIILFKMVVVGWEIWHMRDLVSFRPQPEHQDRCGSLGPLGNLCLYNAAILGIAGLFLGGWIIIGSSTKYGDDYTPLFLAWLPIPLIFSILCFFLPLLNIHRAMQSSRDEVWRDMDRLSYEITQLKLDILHNANALSAKDVSEKIDKLKSMKEVYQENVRYPVWPFDKQMLMKFLTTQSVTILVLLYSIITNGLNSSASQPAFDLIGGTLSLIGGP